MDDTIEYYNKNAEQFAKGTFFVDFTTTQNRFLSKLSAGANILDFGCGSGRDAKYFSDKGYLAEATDGSEELCRLAREYTGIGVKQMLFEELDACEKYDGIWACASILHLTHETLKDVLKKMAAALKANGIVYASFKYRDSLAIDGKYYNTLDIESFTLMMKTMVCDKNFRYWNDGSLKNGFAVF